MPNHNKGAKTIRYIEQQLRKGKTPQELGGKECGRGAVKAAYFFDSPIGGFVVKRNAQQGLGGAEEKNAPKWLKQYGARGCRTYLAGDYIIQEYVTPARKISNFEQTEAYKAYKAIQGHKEWHDIHMGNVGVDANGQLVVFDW